MYQRILLIATIASLISINIYGEEFVGDKLKQSKKCKGKHSRMYCSFCLPIPRYQ